MSSFAERKATINGNASSSFTSSAWGRCVSKLCFAARLFCQSRPPGMEPRYFVLGPGYCVLCTSRLRGNLKSGQFPRRLLGNSQIATGVLVLRLRRQFRNRLLRNLQFARSHLAFSLDQQFASRMLANLWPQRQSHSSCRFATRPPWRDGRATRYLFRRWCPELRYLWCGRLGYTAAGKTPAPQVRTPPFRTPPCFLERAKCSIRG